MKKEVLRGVRSESLEREELAIRDAATAAATYNGTAVPAAVRKEVEIIEID